jgi:hypothetical protein
MGQMEMKCILNIGKKYFYIGQGYSGERCGPWASCYFLSAKKMKSTPWYVLKNFLQHYIWNLERSSKPMLCTWLSEVFDALRKTLVSCRSSQIPLTLHAWKFIYNKILISWEQCAFVLRVQWTRRELLPLKLYNLYVKI